VRNKSVRLQNNPLSFAAMWCFRYIDPLGIAVAGFPGPSNRPTHRPHPPVFHPMDGKEKKNTLLKKSRIARP